MEEDALNETPEYGIDIDTMIAEATAAAMAEDDDQDVGPDESLEDETGELADDEVDDSALDDDDADDEPTSDEDEPETEDDTDPPEEAEDSDPEPDSSTEPDPKDAEIERLLKAQAETLAFQTKLLDMLEQQRVGPKVPAQAPASDNNVPETVARMALFGGEADLDAWKRLDPDTLKKAEKLRNSYADRETRYALNPDLRYQEEIQRHVQAEIQRALSPVLQEREQLTVQKIFNDVGWDSFSKEERAAIQAEYQDLPGANSRSIEDNAKALKAAVKLFQADKKLAALEPEKAKVRSKAKQQRANTRASRKKGGPRPTSSPGLGSLPRLTPDMDVLEYAERLEREGYVT